MVLDTEKKCYEDAPNAWLVLASDLQIHALERWNSPFASHFLFQVLILIYATS